MGTTAFIREGELTVVEVGSDESIALDPRQRALAGDEGRRSPQNQAWGEGKETDCPAGGEGHLGQQFS
jgi:hypothetical protein